MAHIYGGIEEIIMITKTFESYNEALVYASSYLIGWDYCIEECYIDHTEEMWVIWCNGPSYSGYVCVDGYVKR
jgi:hypothetical protein